VLALTAALSLLAFTAAPSRCLRPRRGPSSRKGIPCCARDVYDVWCCLKPIFTLGLVSLLS